MTHLNSQQCPVQKKQHNERFDKCATLASPLFPTQQKTRLRKYPIHIQATRPQTQRFNMIRTVHIEKPEKQHNRIENIISSFPRFAELAKPLQNDLKMRGILPRLPNLDRWSHVPASCRTPKSHQVALGPRGRDQGGLVSEIFTREHFEVGVEWMGRQHRVHVRAKQPHQQRGIRGCA